MGGAAAVWDGWKGNLWGEDTVFSFPWCKLPLSAVYFPPSLDSYASLRTEHLYLRCNRQSFGALFHSRTFINARIDIKGAVFREDVAFPVEFLTHGQRGVFPVHQLIRHVAHRQILEIDVLKGQKRF